MKRLSTIAILALGLTLTGASCGLTTTVKKSVNSTINAAQAQAVSYTGQVGKNALDLLSSGHTVDVSAQGFVNAIDGVKPGDHQFWALYVNGKQAEVGAKDYITKAGDSIEWKLESY